MSTKHKLITAISVAAVLWFYMFSPLTRGLTGFWLTMSLSACILTTLALTMTGFDLSGLRCRKPLLQILLGLAVAFALWGIFWVGDKLSSLMFDFARPQVDAVYSMKDGASALGIAALLLLVIGPAEEFFWRGFIQRKIQESLSGSRHGADYAFMITTLIYAAVHIPSLNFMLVMAALVAGAVWGLIYRMNPGLLPSLIVSHAVWDSMVFVILPI